ncbi:hypothetical protein FY034_07390 [Trichlorobacter lovleyi]|uniref:hypothetical protein n=1 Tax=Trichlorobacter lovleyi TaxID=313985 RepID=UPI00223EA723|nr:hypothetical protein [Trichlorobacter lovleyi]QOX78760.1 hypothetical protein FY034_07390 [Trichlorobacter lovleyi]
MTATEQLILAEIRQLRERLDLLLVPVQQEQARQLVSAGRETIKQHNKALLKRKWAEFKGGKPCVN